MDARLEAIAVEESSASTSGTRRRRPSPSRRAAGSSAMCSVGGSSAPSSATAAPARAPCATLKRCHWRPDDPLTSEHVFQRCRVLIVSLEDDSDELRRRVKAAMMHHQISQDEVKGWLFLIRAGREAGKLLTVNAKGSAVDGGLADKPPRDDLSSARIPISSSSIHSSRRTASRKTTTAAWTK